MIAIATAIQESGLRNLDYGDRDSLGLFQQRPSMGWGTREQILDPRYAATAFYERLLQEPGWEEMPLTEAAQAVQRSAFPDAYARHEPLAQRIVDAYLGGVNLAQHRLDCQPVVSVHGWAAPIVGGEVTSGFRTADRPDHDGVDIAAPHGTPVFAAAAGRVGSILCQATYQGADWGCDRDGGPDVSGCGWYIQILHPAQDPMDGDQTMTRYCHLLRRPDLQVGQPVQAGQPIGLVGSSGHSTGPHLHFEIYVRLDTELGRLGIRSRSTRCRSSPSAASTCKPNSHSGGYTVEDTRSQPTAAEGQAPARLMLVPPEQRNPAGGKVIGLANAGRRMPVGVSLADCRHHLHLLGPTGTGKTTLMLHLALQDAKAGRGVAVFDPSKGDLIRDLLDRLPADCGQRLVLVDPDETTAPPALNLLHPAVGGASPHHIASHITSVMERVWSRWWGDRMSEIAYHGLLTLAHLPNATLADLPRLLGDRGWRTPRVGAVLDALGAWHAGTLAEFWEGFDTMPAGQRGSLVAPLLSRLRLVLAHPLARALFGTPGATFTLADVLNGGVLLVRLPKGEVGEDGCRLIGSLLLAGLWQATVHRSRIPESQRLDAAIYLDEAQNFLHVPVGVDDALAEARGLRVSWTVAHQYLGQLNRAMAAGVSANARNKVYFALAPDDATEEARHVAPWLDAADLTRLGAYEAVLRPIAGGRALPPVTLDTLPAPEVVAGRAAQLRDAARHRTGLDWPTRRKLHIDISAGRPGLLNHPASPTAR